MFGADDGPFMVSLFALLLPTGVTVVFISVLLTSVELLPLLLLDIDCGFVGSLIGGDAGRLRPTKNDCRGDGTSFRPRYCVWGLLLANNADAVMRMEEDIIVF